MEAGEHSLIFFFLQSQLFSLLPKKNWINKGEGERLKNGRQETTLCIHLTFIVPCLMCSANAMQGGRNKTSDEIQSLLSRRFSLSFHNGVKGWTAGLSCPKGYHYCHRHSVHGARLVLAFGRSLTFPPIHSSELEKLWESKASFKLMWEKDSRFSTLSGYSP